MLFDLALMQDELDKHIEKKHKLEGTDLYTKRKIALMVELSELANELRFFKFWSKDQEPRTTVACNKCDGNGIVTYGGLTTLPCSECDGAGSNYQKNPVLEEYVDGIHFILSICLKHPEYQDRNELKYMLDNVTPLSYKNLDDQFNALYFEITSGLYGRLDLVLRYYLGLGEILGFDILDINDAYRAKNAENFNRQARGY